MINYKQILEAVNHGIKLALDNFDDEVPVAQTIGKVKPKDVTSEWLKLSKDFADLGLPSKTLWCRYNLGVDWDKIFYNLKQSKAKNWYGNYYAWGETEPKDVRTFTEFTYKWYKGFDKFNKLNSNGGSLTDYENKITKYCDDTAYAVRNGIIKRADHLEELQLEDDAAYQYDNKFRMPSRQQFEELIKFTTLEFIKDYNNIKDLNGILFTSKINEELLFIPATGSYDSKGISGWRSVYEKSRMFKNKQWCNLWTRSHYNYIKFGNNIVKNDVYGCRFMGFEDGKCKMSEESRQDGLCIRPVLNR